MVFTYFGSYIFRFPYKRNFQGYSKFSPFLFIYKLPFPYLMYQYKNVHLDEAQQSGTENETLSSKIELPHRANQ